MSRQSVGHRPTGSRPVRNHVLSVSAGDAVLVPGEVGARATACAAWPVLRQLSTALRPLAGLPGRSREDASGWMAICVFSGCPASAGIAGDVCRHHLARKRVVLMPCFA